MAGDRWQHHRATASCSAQCAAARSLQGARRRLTVQSALIFLSAVAACLRGGGRAEAQAIRAGFHVANWGLNAPSAEWSGSLPPLASALARVTSPGDPRAETNLPTPFENGAPSAAPIFGAAKDDAVAPLESGEGRLPEKPVTPDSTGSRPATPQPSLAPETRQRLAEAATDRALAPWQREIMLGMAIDGHAGAAGGELPRPPSRATSGEFSTNSDGTWIQEPPVIPERSGHTRRTTSTTAWPRPSASSVRACSRMRSHATRSGSPTACRS